MMMMMIDEKDDDGGEEDGLTWLLLSWARLVNAKPHHPLLLSRLDAG